MSAPARQRGWGVRLLAAPVRGYRRAISPLLPPRCRFAPTCSTYALEALQEHGAARGSWLAVRRVARCHPFHPGGHDPVPRAHRRVGDDAGSPSVLREHPARPVRPLSAERRRPGATRV